MTPSPSPRVAVIDVGKTNVKLVVVDGTAGTEMWSRTAPNRVRGDGPYPHADVEAIEAFLIDALADATVDVGIDAVSVTTHGATGALIASDGLALPVLDYEHDGPGTLADRYATVRPDFAESLSPRLPAGLNLGAQLFWQAHAFPDAFARARTFVTYPQYWAWRLTGVAATEATSLGCHTDLWAPEQRDFSTLVGRMGWGALMAPSRSAFDVLGMLRLEIATRVGLGRSVPVACGIHDSNASLLPHLRVGAGSQSIVSTGTWIVAFAVGAPIGRLDPSRDMLANVDAFGRPIPSARFMGGREFDLLTAGRAVRPDDATVASVVGRGIMAMPGFARGSGPFPDGVGHWSHDTGALTAAELSVAASLYAAMMTSTCLDLLGALGPVTVEGPFARNELFLEALTVVTGKPVFASTGNTGTSAGAAALILQQTARVPTNSALMMDTGRLGSPFLAYAASWRAFAGERRT